MNTKDSVARGSRKLSHAFAEAIKSFRTALHDEDVEAAFAYDAEALQEDAKKKSPASPQSSPEYRYPNSDSSPSV